MPLSGGSFIDSDGWIRIIGAPYPFKYVVTVVSDGIRVQHIILDGATERIVSDVVHPS